MTRTLERLTIALALTLLLAACSSVQRAPQHDAYVASTTGDELRHLRDGEPRARDLWRDPEEDLQHESTVLVRDVTVTRRPACGST
jgi:hypothetical protein